MKSRISANILKIASYSFLPYLIINHSISYFFVPWRMTSYFINGRSYVSFQECDFLRNRNYRLWITNKLFILHAKGLWKEYFSANEWLHKTLFARPGDRFLKKWQLTHYNHGHNIFKIFDTLLNFLFTTSETKRGY